MAALLSACGAGGQLSRDGSQDKLVFPTTDSATTRGGSYPITGALHKLKPGMTKSQIAGLLGRPQFQEGFFGVQEWDDVLNVTNDAGAPQMVCQLKAVFTSSDEARNFYRKFGDNVETLTEGKWQKYPVAQALAQADTQADVMVATQPSLEAVQPSDSATK